MTAPIVPEARKLVEDFEGYHKKLSDGRAAPYLCPARVATLGFGTTYYEGGRKVKMSDPPITRERAQQLLSNQLLSYAFAVDKGVKTSMHSLMRGSLTSFTYNVGTGAFAKSTLLRMVNQQRWSEVPRAFMMYRMGGGRVLAGLERRRKAESIMFMAGVKALQTGGTDNVVPFQQKMEAVPQKPADSIWGRFMSLFGRKAA